MLRHLGDRCLQEPLCYHCMLPCCKFTKANVGGGPSCKSEGLGRDFARYVMAVTIFSELGRWYYSAIKWQLAHHYGIKLTALPDRCATAWDIMTWYFDAVTGIGLTHGQVVVGVYCSRWGKGGDGFMQAPTLKRGTTQSLAQLGVWSLLRQ